MSNARVERLFCCFLVAVAVVVLMSTFQSISVFSCLFSTRGFPEFKVTNREPSEETLNVSEGFNTFLRVFPGSYGELSMVRLVVLSSAVTTTITWPFEKA